MDMGNKHLFLIFGGIIVILGVAMIMPKQKESTILFYGEGCPHCANVDDYIKANGIEGKVKFERKEVYNDDENANLLASKAGQCGLQTGQIGVPFLWDGKNCFIGDEDIIKFFEQKIK